MDKTSSIFARQAQDYICRLNRDVTYDFVAGAEKLAESLLSALVHKRHVYKCGNVGSAANAIHIANDMHFGIGGCGEGPSIPGLCIEALLANTGILTCLANDIGYQSIFSHQLQVKGRRDDILIVLSGSGNSANIIEVLGVARNLGIMSFGILGFDGGRCLELVDVPIYSNIHDMQIAEDLQLLAGHMCMQWLSTNKPSCMQELSFDD